MNMDYKGQVNYQWRTMQHIRRLYQLGGDVEEN